MAKPQSLRAQLLLRLTLPLTLVVLLDAGVSYFVAMHYADLAYDRWLLDSAKSLAQEVKAQKNKVTFDLPPIAVEVFRWDDMDKTFFKVESQAGGFMAGDNSLPSPKLETMDKEQPYFYDAQIQGNNVRVVSVLTMPKASQEEVLVSVAETLNKRRGMMKEIILAVIVPQLLLVLITGLHIWTGINRGLKPLRDLAKIIAGRSARELDPIPDAGVPLEVRALTHTINALLQRLAQAMATQQRFIENAAHQLRTPLAGLKLQAERTLRAGDLDTVRPALQHINNATDRVARLSSQLLVLAQSETWTQSGRDLSPLDLANLARECCMDWVPRALERGMELEFEAPAMPIAVQGNETLLRELLNNLMDNALRYGKPKGKVLVNLEPNPTPTLKVEDDGIGIEPEEQEKVLERFYRIPGSKGDGCGLGLAIVKEIADLHHARVRVGPGREGNGTQVEVVFNLG